MESSKEHLAAKNAVENLQNKNPMNKKMKSYLMLIGGIHGQQMQDLDQVYVSSTDPNLFRDILSDVPVLSKNEYLTQLFHGAYNVHLIATNLTNYTPLIHIKDIVEYKTQAMTIYKQSTYIFENNQWQTQTGELLQLDHVTHLKETDWTTLSRPTDLMVYKSVL